MIKKWSHNNFSNFDPNKECTFSFTMTLVLYTFLRFLYCRFCHNKFRAITLLEIVQMTAVHTLFELIKSWRYKSFKQFQAFLSFT